MKRLLFRLLLPRTARMYFYCRRLRMTRKQSFQTALENWRARRAT